MGTILSLIAGLFNAVSGIVSFFRDRKLVRQGRMEEKLDAVEKVEERASQANRAVAVADDDRDERLRSRFDRARRGE